MRPIITVDFESKPIESRPRYPPEPVGVAIKWPGYESIYYAWAHPEGNNCSWEEGCRIIQDIWRDSSYDILFHYGYKFDQDVAETYMGVDPLPWERVHDTLLQLFLYDPDAPKLGLKESADRLLGLPPEERDVLYEWILRNVPGVTPKGKGLKAPGAWICLAPASLVGPYACGDTDRTFALHEFLYPKILELGMGPAYDRERRLAPYLLQAERDGLLVNIDLLSQDVPTYQESLAIADNWIRERLNVPDLNVDADQKFVLALKAAGSVKQFPRTKPTKRYPGGQESVSKKHLFPDMWLDQPLFHVYGYRNRLSTCLTTFMEKWLSLASPENRIFTNWHQVRTSHADNPKGARTGRVTSSEPPFTNMAKSWEDRNDGYEHPDFLGVPELPLVRQYILPEIGTEWRHRDWRQQEMHILANYENGALMRAYQEDPYMDMHQTVTDIINGVTGRNIHRKICKLIDLGMVYGEGKGKLARQLGIPMHEAIEILDAHRAALPDLKRLMDTIRNLSKAGQPVVTWGGRLYYTQDPKLVDGVMREFIYKQLNRLIQPSAADQAKEAMIRYFEHPKKQGKFLVAVYDEVNVCAEDGDAEDKVLKECMESIECDVFMNTDGKRGWDWGHLEEVHDER